MGSIYRRVDRGPLRGYGVIVLVGVSRVPRYRDYEPDCDAQFKTVILGRENDR